MGSERKNGCMGSRDGRLAGTWYGNKLGLDKQLISTGGRQSAEAVEGARPTSQARAVPVAARALTSPLSVPTAVRPVPVAVNAAPQLYILRARQVRHTHLPLAPRRRSRACHERIYRGRGGDEEGARAALAGDE